MSRFIKCTYVKEVRNAFLTSVARWTSQVECPVGYMTCTDYEGNNRMARYLGQEREGRSDRRKFSDMEKILKTYDRIDSPISKNNLAFSKGRIH